jgi:hypothetical protein
MDWVCTRLVLQGDADAGGFTINNLDLSGLNLTADSVGLGNVDNTSDANKPVSTATNVALGLKEPTIVAGTTAQYWRGDKTWQTLGALGLQAGDTSLQSLSVIGLNALGGAGVSARRHDYVSGPSFAKSSLDYYGASYASSLLGISAANAGAVAFINASYGFIYSNNTAPLIFGYNGGRRMRLMTGLNVGGDTDPGAGCIEAADTITAPELEGDNLTLTGDISSSGGASFGGSNVVIEAAGDITTGGEVVAALGFTTASQIVAAGNLAVGGSIVSFSGLPTSNPGVAGRLWRSGNDVKISTG